MKIGYIGLGALGANLAHRFLADHELVVWDINPAAVAAMEALGARSVATAAALGRECDAVLTCLPRSGDVARVLFGPEGVAEGLSPGKLVIDQTSGVPAETRTMAARLDASGVAMLDASVSSSPALARQGGATLMVGAPDAAFDQALPVLHEITKAVHRCGARVGDGQAMKMVNNAMNGGNRLGTLEMVALGRAMGLSLPAILAALEAGSGCNQIVGRMLPAMMEGRPSTDFALSLMIKDMSQAVALGMEFDAPMPLSSTALGLMQIGLNTIGPAARLEDLIGLTESWSGIRFGAAAAGEPHADAEAIVDAGLEAIGAGLTTECVAAGLRYGLTIESMERVLRNTSGWSASSRRMLADQAAGVSSGAATPAATMVARLRAAASASAATGAPTMLLNVARAQFEAGAA